MKLLLLLTALASPAITEDLPNINFLKPQEKKVMFVRPASSIEWVQMVEGVKFFEGYRSEPYLCPAGVLTVGYGHTSSKAAKRATTPLQAHDLLIADLNKAAQHVDRIVKVELTEGQRAALVSFTFNCGQGNLFALVNGKDRLNDGNYKSIEKILPLYRMADGKILRGLEKRRAFEIDIWKSSDNLFAKN